MDQDDSHAQTKPVSDYQTMLGKALIIPSLKSSDIFSVIAEMIDAMTERGLIADDKCDEVKQAVVRREMCASTVMTDCIALPHGRTDAVEDLICAIGVHKEGFDADADDEQPTHIVTLLVVPPSSDTRYIQFLAQISRVLIAEDKRQAMIEADSVEAILQILG